MKKTCRELLGCLLNPVAIFARGLMCAGLAAASVATAKAQQPTIDDFSPEANEEVLALAVHLSMDLARRHQL